MRLFNAIFYYGIIIPISYLPYPVLYLVSDGLYFLIYRVFGYRKKVVVKNIANSFPNKSPQEQQQIVSDFYRHFCDLLLEGLKAFTMSEAEVKQRAKPLNLEYINRFYEKGQNVIIATSHYNNWELLALALNIEIKHQAVVIYRQLKNKFFDKKVKASRSRFGLILTSTKIAMRAFQKAEDLSAVTFAFDQSPGKTEGCYWGSFLNQDTPMTFGVEKYAKRLNTPVLFMHINKVKRGYYTYEFSDAIEDPRSTGYGEITKKINALLEQDIIAQPEYYLWTHKKWKHKRPVDLVRAD
ncbi:MAG: lauroyl acyltransferase [Cyclobacteriaceae bacterium]|jgi:KDO2-lipid IV(A) lauroyltransferase|nr:lauroyl acyltransferase [Cyclobacteriaceae bacterium]